jgi:Predicted esterase
MKHFLVVTLFIAVILCLSGCNNASKETQNQRSTDPTPTITGEAKSGSSNEEGTQASDQNDSQKEIELKKGTIETVEIDSKAIADNLIKENTKHQIHIYLPPTYSEGNKKYPVIYFLHGFGDSPTEFINNAQDELNEAFSKDSSKEFILVEIEGGNSAGGSFYVNSPVIGKWEDYTTKEVVSYLDSNYRTIAKAQSRGICGFSMGGFGALNLAFRHPDVYSAVYTFSPGVLAPGKIGDALDSWENDDVFLKAYSYAFAYQTKSPFETLPLRDGSKKDNDLLKRWESGFGNWKEKIDAYLSLNTPLKAIGVGYGKSDSYKWIPEGSEYLSDILDEKEIKNTLISYQGGHNIPYEGTTEYLLPFFNEALVWE